MRACWFYQKPVEAPLMFVYFDVNTLTYCEEMCNRKSADF